MAPAYRPIRRLLLVDNPNPEARLEPVPQITDCGHSRGPQGAVFGRCVACVGIALGRENNVLQEGLCHLSASFLPSLCKGQRLSRKSSRVIRLPAFCSEQIAVSWRHAFLQDFPLQRLAHLISPMVLHEGGWRLYVVADAPRDQVLRFRRPLVVTLRGISEPGSGADEKGRMQAATCSIPEANGAIIVTGDQLFSSCSIA
jgi:hypothetical protein